MQLQLGTDYYELQTRANSTRCSTPSLCDFDNTSHMNCVYTLPHTGWASHNVGSPYVTPTPLILKKPTSSLEGGLIGSCLPSGQEWCLLTVYPSPFIVVSPVFSLGKTEAGDKEQIHINGISKALALEQETMTGRA